MVKKPNVELIPVEMPDGTHTYTAKVTIVDDATGEVVLRGECSIATADETAAANFVEFCYLPDLVKNLPNQVGDMPVSQPPVPEPPPQDPPVEPGV